MVQPLPDDDDFPCARCHKPAKPFGPNWPQRFFVDGIGFLCVECARREIPDNVRFAEEFDAEAGRRENKG